MTILPILPDLNRVPFTPARWFTPGRTSRIRYILVHCTVGSERDGAAAAVAHDFATRGPDRKGSTQMVVDGRSIIRCVADTDTAYGCKSFNNNGLHVEICGLPDQIRAQWLDTVSRQAIRNAAWVIAWWHQHVCPDVPVDRRLTPDEARAGRPGLLGHVDADAAFPSSGHWDPGPHFPWDVLLADIAEILEGNTMTEAERDALVLQTAEAVHQVLLKSSVFAQRIENQVEDALQKSMRNKTGVLFKLSKKLDVVAAGVTARDPGTPG